MWHENFYSVELNFQVVLNAESPLPLPSVIEEGHLATFRISVY
jgi:hypothetical protein